MINAVRVNLVCPFSNLRFALQVCGDMDDDGNIEAPAPPPKANNISLTGGPVVGQKRSISEV